MARFIEFKGLKHYPIGDAALDITDKGLKVSKIGDSGLDGVSIRTNGIESLDISFLPLEMTSEKSYTFNLIGEDGFGRIKTMNQQAITLNPDNKNSNLISFNSYLLSEKITILAEKNGKIIYKQEYDNPNNNPKVNWWVVGVAVAIYIANHVDYKHKVIKDKDGNVTGTETTTSWNGSTWRMPGGKSIEADRFYLQSNFNFPEPLKALREITVKEIQILGRNLKEMIISDEEYPKN